MKPPKKWKMAIIVWMAIYPCLTCLFLFGGKYLMMIEPLPLRTFCITAIIIPFVTFVLLPFLQKTFKNWLFK